VDFSLKQDPLDKGHLIIIIKPSKPSQLKPAVVNSSPGAANTRLPE